MSRFESSWQSCHTVHVSFQQANKNVQSVVRQELSYRKQIARQLRTQYVEGIYSQGWKISWYFWKYQNIENIKMIMIFFIFSIFSIFFRKWKFRISCNNNGCNTLMQYLMTISYQSFVPHVKTSLLGELYCVTFALWHEPCPSVCCVCRMWRCCTLLRGIKFSAIFLHHVIT